MKLIISLIMTFNLYAGHIIHISHSKKNKSKARYIKEHFISKYKVPMHLIRTVSEKCEVNLNKIIHICIESDGSLNFRQKNSELISSLQIFNRPY
jgi:hypothetical protein